ncbi:MAG: glycoside hydrolase family 3 C-terminal domain-containing protein [Clostridiales bacterium]|nr:glycoside hydrolase family 3 C-terminal domain-containing protein [Clostridiales bacterium]
MKLKKFSPLLRGLAATTAALLTISTVGYNVALSDVAIGWMDGWFAGTDDRNIYETKREWVEEEIIPGAGEERTVYVRGRNYTTTHETVEEYYDALKAHIIKQGEEGFALLKNDNKALPIASGSTVALFGWGAYNLNTAHTGVTGGGETEGEGRNAKTNVDVITLDKAFESISGITVEPTVQKSNFSGTVGKASANYKIAEGAPVTEGWNITKDKTTGIVVLGRGGGENANYTLDSAQGANDPLAISENEKTLIQEAKTRCSKVVVLICSANAMEIGDIAKGGDLEVDAIGFVGIPNNYQWQGIANVLAGKVNATGALTDTYAYDNSYNPAAVNQGGQQYTNKEIITSTEDALGRASGTNVLANNYIVEAEGIYVGYKYYETRYYDSYANPTYNAKATIGSSTDAAWDYSKEVVFTFGTSLSYIPYTQTIKSVDVDLEDELGDITVTIDVKNDGTQDGYFLTQLYVNKPYTTYDIQHNVEKSAVDFLNSGKVSVKAGATETVTLTLPTRYLASWDSNARNGKGSYILDDGDYYFTAAAGAHAAANNFLDAQGHEHDKTTVIGETVKWSLGDKDETTFSVSNGVEVKNQMQNADINYYLPGTVTYLSRSNWQGTFPKNYTSSKYDSSDTIESADAFTIGGEKMAEWINELRNTQYVPKKDPNANKQELMAAELPDNVGPGKEFSSIWAYIINVSQTNPEAFNNINSEEWQTVKKAINLNVAITNVLAGGGSTKSWYGIGNPTSTQSESVAGYSQALTVGNKKYNLALASNTLLGSSFNPKFAEEWGKLEGEGGLWLQKEGVGSGNAITVWGGGLNQHRHPYNGRNSEYMSEDPMLTNRIGYGQYKGIYGTGAINGPKHMGFNDQETNRQGNAPYMTEQKVRETDIRCYEGALRVEEGRANGVMMSFSRIGATNTTNSVGLIKNIMRGEWGFTGIVTTDMGQAGYHEPLALIMATVNQYASFGPTDTYMGANGSGEGSYLGDDAHYSAGRVSFPYITLGLVNQDPVFCAQARETALYELYTIAHSGSGMYVEEIFTKDDVVIEAHWNEWDEIVGKYEHREWEYVFIALEAVFGVLTGLAGIAYIASLVIPGKKED